MRTLEQWAGLTMKQKTVLFHRRFTNKRIAVTSLRRLYLKHKIRRKRVRQEKCIPENVRLNYAQRCLSVLQQLDHAHDTEQTVVYLDEVNFTKRSLSVREWSNRNTNLTIDQEDVYTGYRSVISTMTEQGGMLHMRIQSSAVDSDDFIAYLKQLRRKIPDRPIALFMDNLAVHRAIKVKEWYQTLNITTIMNVSYSPAFNPIESVFSKVKALFNRRRLNNLVNRTGFNFDNEIKAAFRQVKADHCGACVRKSRFLLTRAAHAPNPAPM
jgi:transposase